MYHFRIFHSSKNIELHLGEVWMAAFVINILLLVILLDNVV